MDFRQDVTEICEKTFKLNVYFADNQCALNIERDALFENVSFSLSGSSTEIRGNIKNAFLRL